MKATLLSFNGLFLLYLQFIDTLIVLSYSLSTLQDEVPRVDGESYLCCYTIVQAIELYYRLNRVK